MANKTKRCAYIFIKNTLLDLLFSDRIQNGHRVIGLPYYAGYISRHLPSRFAAFRFPLSIELQTPTMVFYLLSFTAELENLTNLQPRDGCDDPNYVYGFKVF